jgi:putative glutamine amidotransferase
VNPVAVTSRVVVDPAHHTRYDAVDQRWWSFLASCGLVAVPLPNREDVALDLVRGLPVRGLLLTGGNDLGAYGGDAPERDRTENAVLDHALVTGLPVVAVCRGMQLLLHRFGVRLRRVAGHVAPRQIVAVDGRHRVVNSYHQWAATYANAPLEVWARTPDSVVKAVRHKAHPTVGVMWHPERLPGELAGPDRTLISEQFGGRA